MIKMAPTDVLPHKKPLFGTPLMSFKTRGSFGFAARPFKYTHSVSMKTNN